MSSSSSSTAPVGRLGSTSAAPIEVRPDRSNRDESDSFGADSEFEGTLKFNQAFRLFGRTKGALVGGPKAILYVEEGAVHEGEINVPTIYVYGQVKGPVRSSELFSISKTGRQEGDVSFKEIQLERGAIVTGQMKQIDDAA